VLQAICFLGSGFQYPLGLGAERDFNRRAGFRDEDGSRFDFRAEAFQ